MKSKPALVYLISIVVLSLALLIGSFCDAAEDYELFIAQGLEKLNQSKFDESLELLKKALDIAPENTEALYYTGVAYTRLGKLDEAEELFKKILSQDKSFTSAYLELGRIYYIQSDCDGTSKYLSDYISLSDDKAMKDYAGELMTECTHREVKGKEAEKEKKLSLFLSVGTQYDDNVILEPSNPVVSAETESDGRVVAYLIANADLLSKGNMDVKADYNFYQSVHFDLDDFNVHFHKIHPFLEIGISEIVKSKIGYSYSYTLLGQERYSGIHAIDVNTNIKEGEYYSTDVVFEYENLDYWNSDLFEENSIRSGYQNTIGIKQNFIKDKMGGKIFYFGEFNRADEDYWSYDGHKVGAELSFHIAAPLYLTISGEYSESRYRDNDPRFQIDRVDEVQQYSLIFAYKLSDRMALYVSDDYTVNDSNLADFDYKRNIVGFYLTMSVL